MHYSRISFRDFLFSRDLWPCGCMRWPPAYPLAFPRHQLTVQPTSKSLAIIAISSHLLVNTLRASVQRAGFSSLTLQPEVKPKMWRNVGSLWHLIIVEMVLRHIPTWYYLGDVEKVLFSRLGQIAGVGKTILHRIQVIQWSVLPVM